MAQLRPLTKSDYLVTLVTDTNATGGTQTSSNTSVDTVSKNIWTSCSAFKFTNNTSKFNDGQSYIMKTLTGSTEYENLTLARPFDPAIHGDFLQTIHEVQEQGKVFTVTITPGKKSSTSTGFVPSSSNRSLSLFGCELVSLSIYDADGSSADASSMEIVIAPNGHSFEGVSVSETSGTLSNNISAS